MVALILAVYIAEMLLLMRTGGGLLRPRKTTMPVASEDMRKLRAEMDSMQERIAELENSIAPLKLEHRSELMPHSRAIQMAKQGRDANRISEECGISRGEAELIVSMHGLRE